MKPCNKLLIVAAVVTLVSFSGCSRTETVYVPIPVPADGDSEVKTASTKAQAVCEMYGGAWSAGGFGCTYQVGDAGFDKDIPCDEIRDYDLAGNC